MKKLIYIFTFLFSFSLSAQDLYWYDVILDVKNQNAKAFENAVDKFYSSVDFPEGVTMTFSNIALKGQGFKEKDTNKIFKRFYSNRPDKFGQHSGLGLNIVKNLVDLHNATIKATNRQDKKGASMEIEFPKV